MSSTEFVGSLVVGLSTLVALLVPLITQVTKVVKQLTTTNVLLSEIIKQTDTNSTDIKHSQDDIHAHDLKLENHEQRIHVLEENTRGMSSRGR